MLVSLVSGRDRAPSGMSANRPDISVIVPIYNEVESLPNLLDALSASLDRIGRSYELIAIDDGSRDGSLRLLREEAARRPKLKVVAFRRNAGQTAAMMAGIDHASGEIIISIDADLQNDPDDIPLLLAKIDEGYDVVSGWRQDRKDDAIRRNFVSRVANGLISAVSGVHLNDYGCTLKAYRADVIKGVRLYGEMHRFIPIYASWWGARVTEVPVRHHARKFGQSKYGLNRIIKVILDLMVVKFMDKFFSKPMYVFGTFGLASMVLSGLAFVYMIYLKFADNISMIQTPLPVAVALFFMLGVLSILLGLIAEMLLRTYYESQQRAAYLVLDRINFDAPDDVAAPKG